MKKSSQYIFDKYVQSEKLRQKRKENALNNFINKINISRGLNFITENNTKDNWLKTESRKNLLINSVTSVEVFIKESIKGKHVYFPEEGQKELLKEKISLWEAYELFRNTNIRTVDIIADYYSFQNLDSIQYVLSTLTGKDFYQSMNNIELDLVNNSKYFKRETLNLKNDYPNWQKNLRELFDIRHESVHDVNFKKKLGKRKTDILFDNLLAFVFILDKFFSQTIRDFITKLKSQVKNPI